MRAGVAAGLLAVALSACGTTVPQSPGGQAAGGQPIVGDELGPPALDPRTPGGVGAGPVDGSGAGSPTGPTSTSSPVAGVGPSPSVGGPAVVGAPDRTPISIGILYVNNDSGAGAAGVDNGNTFTPRRAYEAVVTAHNARGGVGGRRIRPVYVELRSSSTTLRADIDAACSRFTQDERVSAVWGGTGIYSESFSTCLARSGTPQLLGDYALGDDDALRRAPYLVPTATLTTDDRVRLLLEHLTRAGRLKASDKLGIVVEGCPFNQRTYTRTVVPTARRLGLSISQRVETRCFEDISDLGGQASDMQGAVLRFQTNAVDQVLFVSGSVESNLLLYFALAAESQRYHPGYALTSAAAAAVQEANTPAAQLANAVGLGWLPAIDSNRVASPLPAARRCLQDLQRIAGITPQGAVDRAYAFGACDTAGLYDAALRKTSGNAEVSAVLGAVSALGDDFSSASSYGERTDFRGGRRTGPSQGRVFAWSTSCTCFAYTGSPVSLTPG